MKQREAIRKRLAVLALALTLCLHICVPASAEGTKNLPDTAKEAAESALTYGQATSISWAVWQDGDIIASGQEGGEDASAAPSEAGLMPTCLPEAPTASGPSARCTPRRRLCSLRTRGNWSLTSQ